MSVIKMLIRMLLHVDEYLNVMVQNYGIWTYSIIFLIIFCETGLVVTPFLPGDSILFTVGALASTGSLKLLPLFLIFYLAAILGDTVNYFIGKKIGHSIFQKENIKYINKKYLKKAHDFYKNHGSMTIVLGRFIPIIRTFVPFVAGIGEMNYSKFIIYNMIGGVLWVTVFLGGGYLFGGLPFVKQHFSYIVIAILIISIIPAVITIIKEKGNKNEVVSKESI